MGRGAERQNIDQHTFVITDPVGPLPAILWLPPHRDAVGIGQVDRLRTGGVALRPVPFDPAIDLFRQIANFRLDRIVAVVIALREQRTAQKQRRIDSGQLVRLVPRTIVIAQEVVEEAFVARLTRGLRPLRGVPVKRQTIARALGRLLTRDIAALGTDPVSGQREPGRRNRRERAARPPIGRKAAFGIGGIPEIAESALRQLFRKCLHRLWRCLRRFNRSRRGGGNGSARCQQSGTGKRSEGGRLHGVVTLISFTTIKIRRAVRGSDRAPVHQS